ncbi:juvenile hormone esterase-like [Battus philenor]|uniref:juvenile hormone esterase-like n=1 Tax=Battus philenor TaxID=42288 RepID=UPI0035CF0072
MCFVVVLIHYIFLIYHLSLTLNSQSIIRTNSGPVRGALQRYEEIFYYSYQGIPYAECPTGALRFRPPVMRQPWTNIFNATREPPVCPQIEVKYKKEQMDEDCLRLNIFVPENLNSSLPVLVFIHGGAFEFISGNTDIIYGPQLLLRQGIIIITINYRLGPLGFMSLGIEEASGNAGLKDIILALRWIKNNIKQFGGDSNNISLGGNSSGATIVNYLLLTKHSSGLFQRAILLSGSALSYRALSKHPIENTLELAKELCSVTDDVYLILKCLREADVFDIIKARIKLKNKNNNILRPFTPFLPSVENNFTHAVITKDPKEILELHEQQNVPIFAGFNGNEGIYMTSLSFRYPNVVLNNLRKNIELTIPSNIEYPLGLKQSTTLANSIVKFYFGDENFSNWTLNNAYDYISDTHYVFGIDTWINLHKEKKDSSAVYYYIFDFDGNFNWCKIYYNITYPGTSHADDLGYLFLTNATKLKFKHADERSLRTVNLMTTLLSNFVKYGNPTPKNYSNFIWPEYGTERKMALLSDEPSVIQIFEPIKKRLKFWTNVYKEYNNFLNKGGKLEYKIIP